MEKISVIVPVYNVEKYLKKCIDSLIKQTYRNLEIILVDDGSTDSSRTICESYKYQDDRIKVIHKKNGGLSSARNAGIEIAQGDYFIFVDSDDYINHYMVQELYNALVKTNSDIAVCKYTSVYEDTEINCGIKNNEEKEYHILTGKEACNKIYNNEYSIDFTVAWNKLYKREVFQEIRYPHGKVHEDEFVTFRLLYNAKRIVYIPIPLYYYLQRENSIMSRQNVYWMDRLEAYKETVIFYEKIDEQELFHNAVIRFLDNIIGVFLSLENNYKKEECQKVKKIYKKEYLHWKQKTTFSWPKKIKYLGFNISTRVCMILLYIWEKNINNRRGIA